MLNGFLKSLGMGKSRRNQVAQQSRAFFEPMESRRLLALFAAPELGEINAPLINYTLPPNNSSNIYYVASNVTSNKISTDRTDPGNLLYTLNNAANESTIILRGGDYRLTSQYNLTKKLTIQAYPNEQPIIKGSALATSWTKTTDAKGNDVWYTPWTYKFTHGSPDDVQDPDRPESVYLDMVYRNGNSIRQVLDNPMTSANEGPSARPFAPGTFWLGTVGSQQRVYVADNPVNQTMEITRINSVIKFSAGAQGTVMKGITIAHAANNGVELSCGSITFENNLFAWNGNSGFNLASGSTTMRGNAFVSNGHVGVSGNWNNSSSPGIFEYNYAAWNNCEGFKYSWAAAGVKFINADNLKAYNNVIENNYAMGLWFDVHSNNGQMIGNVVRNNLGYGLFHESSYGGIIAFNLAENNTWGNIQIADAGGIQVWNNTVIGADEGIIVKDGVRFNAPGKTTYNYDQNELIKGSWEISYANVIKNNIISSSKNRLIKANEVYDPQQDADPVDATHPEGTTIGNIFNPLPLTHQGSKSMFYTTSGTTGTWTAVPNAINYNAFHNIPTGTGKGAVIWKSANGGTSSTWTPTQFKNNTDQSDNFLELSSSDALFVDGANKDYRLINTSAAVGAGTSIPTAIRNAAAAAGINISLYNTSTPNLGAYGALPSGWSAKDIGSPAIAGSTNFRNNIWTIAGAGANISGTSDQFQFARNTFNADTTSNYTVVARVDSQTNTHDWAKAGVVIRGNESAGSRYAGVFLTPAKGVVFQWRDSQDGDTQSVQVTGITGPVWVKVVKQGNTMTGYYRTANTGAWTSIGSATVSIASTSFGGLAVTSRNSEAVSTATFSSVTAAAGLL